MIEEKKEINEHIIQLSGKANIEEALSNDNRYTIVTEVEIDGANEKPTKNGKFDVIYKAKTTGILEIADSHGKIMRNKGGERSESQKTRIAVAIYHKEHYGEPTYEFIHHNEDEFYRQVQDKLRSQLPNILRYLFTKS